MELSRGMLRRMLSCVLSIVLLGSCTGCSFHTFTDYLRPDLNLLGRVQVYPNPDDTGDGSGNASTVEPGEPATFSPGSVWSGGSPNKKDYHYQNPNRIVDTNTFAGTPYEMLGADNYGEYLEECVFTELKNAIDGLDEETKAKICIRVGHTGYGMRSGKLCRVAGWSGSIVGDDIKSAQVVAGNTLVKFADDWVGGLSVNQNSKAQQISFAQQTIKDSITVEEPFSKNWYELADSGMPTAYYKMFGRTSAGFTNLQQYYDAIAASPFNNIPNYSMTYRTGTNSTDTLTFNRVTSDISDEYQEGVPTATIDKLFSTYNQYTNREREPLSNIVTDKGSLLKYYLDGYNKTIIFVGTTSGSSLKDVVGTAVYNKLNSIVSDAYLCIEPNSIINTKKNITVDGVQYVTDYSMFTAIPAGTKGVD